MRIYKKIFMIQHNDLQLQKNEFIIHLKHGLGQFKGLKVINYNNIPAEYFTIIYADNAKLYIPIHHIYLIKKYNHNLNNEKIFLHKLGCKKWSQERDKIFKKIEDSAIKILDNHAYRILQPGFSFKKYSLKYDVFCKKFPHEMTTDQNKVMQDILSDMNKSTPMDRLICGDVGFGKTEIALRASFIAVQNQKQVLILVPTTLLAQQHYKSFKNRFTDFSITVDILSRFQTKTQQMDCIKNIKLGKNNIIISTHKILFHKINWLDLGLLIIDEEHRFGVQQKENIKKNFHNIDVLTLTATPIPRTLNMAMSGIRDLSIISTPPKNRYAIKTFVKEYNLQLIRKIILDEIYRKGQVYYICNKVKNLSEKLVILKKLVPEAKFQMGHGKMNGKILKKIIYDFAKQRFNVLICTTIIETGIDIPTVNSIIIEDSHLFGLAQLHQMRGRVGRSDVQSYAWLLTNQFYKKSSNSAKRLQVINSIQKLGSGFELSKHDLNIRGVGEILGYHQSGNMKNIELSLYLDLLNKTIKIIKNNSHLSLSELEKNQPEIELSISSILPTTYIPNVNERLYFYKKIFSANQKHELKSIKSELIRKFGSLPLPAKNLILTIKIKFLLNSLGINKIQSNALGGKIFFSKNKKIINIDYLLNLCALEFQSWNMYSQNSLKYNYNIPNDIDRIHWLLNFLNKMQKNIKFIN